MVFAAELDDPVFAVLRAVAVELPVDELCTLGIDGVDDGGGGDKAWEISATPGTVALVPTSAEPPPKLEDSAPVAVLQPVEFRAVPGCDAISEPFIHKVFKVDEVCDFTNS